VDPPKFVGHAAISAQREFMGTLTRLEKLKRDLAKSEGKSTRFPARQQSWRPRARGRTSGRDPEPWLAGRAVARLS
jgi:hypothetical protein